MYAATLAIVLASVGATPAEQDYSSADSNSQGYEDDCGCNDCSVCNLGGKFGGKFGKGGRHGAGKVGGWCGPMPQTCYAPRYGCYPGNNRHMHRYPAFHGVYYRRPYNYRNLFDYPWHAELREPTSLFSYETPEEEYDDSYEDEVLDDAAPVDDRGGEARSQRSKSVRSASVPARHNNIYRDDNGRVSSRRRIPVDQASAEIVSQEVDLQPVPEDSRIRVSSIVRRHRSGSSRRIVPASR